MTNINELLTPIEIEALRLLLDGEHAVLNQLRRQLLDIVQVKRRFTGVGLESVFVLPEKAQAISGQPDFAIDDVSGSVSGTVDGACFILFVRDGKLSGLEAATFGIDGADHWPKIVTSFKLGYDSGQWDWTRINRLLDDLSKNKLGNSTE